MAPVALMQQDAERTWFEVGRAALTGEVDGIGAL